MLNRLPISTIHRIKANAFDIRPPLVLCGQLSLIHLLRHLSLLLEAKEVVILLLLANPPRICAAPKGVLICNTRPHNQYAAGKNQYAHVTCELMCHRFFLSSLFRVLDGHLERPSYWMMIEKAIYDKQAEIISKIAGGEITPLFRVHFSYRLSAGATRNEDVFTLPLAGPTEILQIYSTIFDSRQIPRLGSHAQRRDFYRFTAVF